MIVQMSHQLLPRIDRAAAKEFFYALNHRASFFAGVRVRYRSGCPAIKSKEQQADI
jgi:hypothetical protein